MRDFKSFANSSKNISKEDQKKVDDYKNIYDKYKNMDNNELMSSLFREANKLKNEGKLDNNTLDNLSTTLSPYLNTEQKKMLTDLVDMIKDK